MGLEPGPVADEPVRIECGPDVVPFFTQHPALASRRASLDSADLVRLLGEALVRRGVPAERLSRSRWVWTTGEDGCPKLYLIFPGLEA